MAFVFRSEKKNQFDPTHLEINKKQVTIEEPAKPKLQNRLWKGLPHFAYLQKDQKHSSSCKQNFVPFEETKPIHFPTSQIITKKSGIFASSSSLTKKLFHLSEKNQQNLGKILQINEIGNEQKTNMATYHHLMEKQIQKYNQQFDTNKKVERYEQREQPTIVNKNLMKTLENLKATMKQEQEDNLKKIVVSQEKNTEVGMVRKPKQKNWKSLNKLSPMKEYSKILQKINSDIPFLGKNKENDELSTAEEKKARITKKKQTFLKKNTDKLDQYSDQQEQYEDDATPGPGSYQYQKYSDKKQFRSKKEKFQKIFISPLQRFKERHIKYQQVTYVNQPDQLDSSLKNKSICQSFLSKSPKFTDPVFEDNPPPGYYDTRQTLQHDLVRKIVKSSNTNTFISREPRLSKVKDQDKPGPGFYTLDRSFQKLQQEKDILSYNYKSQLERHLQYTKKSNPLQKSECQLVKMSKDDRINPIHIKDDSILEDLYILEPPPFLSGTERFPKIKKQSFSRIKLPLKQSENIVKSPSKQPFNSSQKRQLIQPMGQGVGIGLYNISGVAKWQKKSFNVLFN